MNALTKSNFNFSGQESVYHGKVRDVHHLGDKLLVMVASDRISAFDHILPKGIPFKISCPVGKAEEAAQCKTL